jgi:predicted O-methyltransferase YrrM
VTGAAAVPAEVEAAIVRAKAHRFAYSCEPPVGPLLAALAAAVPTRGRILELGTGVGVSAAWLVSGLRGRSDVTLTSVESSATTAEVARNGDWPSWVDIRVGDAEELLPSLGQFDLVFADAPGGKWTGLQLTVEALRPGGVLVLDDMDLARYPAEHVPTVATISRTLLTDPRLAVVELPTGTGLLLATRRTPQDSPPHDEATRRSTS